MSSALRTPKITSTFVSCGESRFHSTFRAAQSVLVGGVARLDVVAAPAATIYITLWASADLVTHFGKTDVAADKCGAELLLWVPTVCVPADVNN